MEKKEETRKPIDEDHHTKQLSIPWANMRNPQKMAYLQSLKRTLEENPGMPYKALYYKTIGDIFFTVNDMRAMRRYYIYAVNADSTLGNTTPAGYRIETAGKMLMRNNILIAIYAGYFLIVCFFVRAIYRKYTFDWKLFVGKLTIIIALWLIIIPLIAYTDFNITKDAIIPECLKQQPGIFINPIFPFSIFNRIELVQTVVLVSLGLLPALLVALYSSFSSTKREIVPLLLILLISIIAPWAHFIIIRAFDNRLNRYAVFTKGHIYIKGEIEEAITKNSHEIIKTNPDFLKYNNKDLELFLEKNMPELLEKEE